MVSVICAAKMESNTLSVICMMKMTTMKSSRNLITRVGAEPLRDIFSERPETIIYIFQAPWTRSTKQNGGRFTI